MKVLYLHSPSQVQSQGSGLPTKHFLLQNQKVIGIRGHLIIEAQSLERRLLCLRDM
jgi:hypothetical protein